MLRSARELEAACAELKRVCYERGAEDNLTAVLVRVGGDAKLHTTIPDDEPTLIRERTDARTASAEASDASATAAHLRRPFDDGTNARAFVPASRSETSVEGAPSSNVRAAERKGKKGALAIPFLLILIAGAAALAFYVGMMYERKGANLVSGKNSNEARGTTASVPTNAAPLPSPAATTSTQATFESRRAAVDSMPGAEIDRMNAQTSGQPLTSDDPEFLYLYGRALLLTDRQQEAIEALEAAIKRADEKMTPSAGELKIDAYFALATAYERAGNGKGAAETAGPRLNEVTRPRPQQQVNANVSPSPGVTP